MDKRWLEARNFEDLKACQIAELDKLPPAYREIADELVKGFKTKGPSLVIILVDLAATTSTGDTFTAPIPEMSMRASVSTLYIKNIDSPELFREVLTHQLKYGKLYLEATDD